MRFGRDLPARSPKGMEATIVYWGHIRIMEKKMETTVVYRGYIGIMEKRMKTTVVYWG